MNKVSVIMATGNKKLVALRNTLTSWSQVTYPVEFILIDTDNSVEVESLVKDFPFISRLAHIPSDDKSRDWARVSRAWTREGRQCSGDYVIVAMADELLGSYDIVEKFLASPTKYRSSVLNYFLSDRETSQLSSLNWQGNPKSLEEYPDFWTHQTVQGADIVPNSFRKDHPQIAESQSHITGAPREHWEYMNWFRTDDRGYWWLDMDLYFRELKVNRPAITLPDFVCYHQWHPLLELTPRDRDFGGYIYETDLQARLLQPAKRINEDISNRA